LIREIDGSTLSVDSITIALGHEVLIMGKLDATASFYSIQSISNHFFSTLNDHFSILSIELDGKEMMKTILNKENKFTAQVNEVIPKEAIKSAFMCFSFCWQLYCSIFCFQDLVPKRNDLY
jgi:hypothetical protein